MDWGQVAYAQKIGDPNKMNYVMKASANTSMTGVGFVPGVGWIVSGTYFLGDALIPGGWGAAIEAGYRTTLHNREVIPNWNPKPQGGLGN
jgi:roadblock/LC7 domain-containing protein